MSTILNNRWSVQPKCTFKNNSEINKRGTKASIKNAVTERYDEAMDVAMSFTINADTSIYNEKVNKAYNDIWRLFVRDDSKYANKYKAIYMSQCFEKKTNNPVFDSTFNTTPLSIVNNRIEKEEIISVLSTFHGDFVETTKLKAVITTLTLSMKKAYNYSEVYKKHVNSPYLDATLKAGSGDYTKEEEGLTYLQEEATNVSTYAGLVSIDTLGSTEEEIVGGEFDINYTTASLTQLYTILDEIINVYNKEVQLKSAFVPTDDDVANKCKIMKASGMKYKDIATELNISLQTVKRKVNNVSRAKVSFVVKPLAEKVTPNENIDVVTEVMETKTEFGELAIKETSEVSFCIKGLGTKDTPDEIEVEKVNNINQQVTSSLLLTQKVTSTPETDADNETEKLEELEEIAAKGTSEIEEVQNEQFSVVEDFVENEEVTYAADENEAKIEVEKVTTETTIEQVADEIKENYLNYYEVAAARVENSLTPFETELQEAEAILKACIKLAKDEAKSTNQ